jgi:hypothetical protein
MFLIELHQGRTDIRVLLTGPVCLPSLMLVAWHFKAWRLYVATNDSMWHVKYLFRNSYVRTSLRSICRQRCVWMQPLEDEQLCDSFSAFFAILGKRRVGLRCKHPTSELTSTGNHSESMKSASLWDHHCYNQMTSAHEIRQGRHAIESHPESCVILILWNREQPCRSRNQWHLIFCRDMMYGSLSLKCAGFMKDISL